jgi:predicted AAA+ superfamily ATPase
MISRTTHRDRVMGLLKQFPVVAILGARQVGKTTLSTLLDVRPQECYFWATHAGAELDLLVVRGRKR